MRSQEKNDPEKTDPKKQGSENDPNKSKDPRKPGVDPDQTPERELEQVPVANPDTLKKP
jgi:hypothetical protein